MATIVVPLDGSQFAEASLRVARFAAKTSDRDLRLVQVVTPGMAKAGDTYLEGVARVIDDVDVTTALVTRHRGDLVADGIEQAARDADPGTIVCMTAHGRTGLGAAILGSTTEDLLRSTRRPVVVVGRQLAAQWPEHRRVLVPLDGSAQAEQIIPDVAGMATDWGLEPWLLQVVHPFDDGSSKRVDASLGHARSRLHDLGVEAKTDIQFASNAGLNIDQQARSLGAALIVMSSYIAPGVARTLLGSVTMNVIHRAPCPVLVCPRPEAPG